MAIKSFKMNKLIRDQLPSIMLAKGVVMHNSVLSSEEFVDNLKNKLIEECQEVVESGSKEEHIDELADVLEVFHALTKALKFAKDRLESTHSPDGYNIGINCGKTAGQSVMHLHIHLIPRYNGDMEDPKGGVRGVIPSKQKY